MPPITDALRECHRLRKHLKMLQEEIDRGPRVLRIRQEALEAARQAHKAHHDAIKQLQLKQREEEGTLKQTDVRLAKLEEQLSGIVNAKEYEAKQAEIAHARQKKSDLEDSIIATMSEIEEKIAATPAVEEKWAAAQAEFAEYQKQAAERLEMLKNDQVASREALAQLEANLPETIKARYDQLVKAHGPEAMAGVKNKTCEGCRTLLPDQRLTDIRNGQFVLCSICGRMLYPALDSSSN
jgi:predicted  nucleic acid-binding Zn-ribbon protein